MPRYPIILYKEKTDLRDGNSFKKIFFDGRYVDALHKARKNAEEFKCKYFDVEIAPSTKAYKTFLENFKKLTENNKTVVTNVLSNIFTMRLIGNKTHGDLAEIGIAEFINRFMPNYSADHVGKELYRAKGHEEDIVVCSKTDEVEIPISLKAYGDGPLQLSTNKESTLWDMLEDYGDKINDCKTLEKVLNSNVIQDIFRINVMPLIYRESTMECNILIFDFERALKDVKQIEKTTEGKGRKHPIYKFTNSNKEYICEVRYGGKDANALQRGLWTNTSQAAKYFDSVTNGWIKYKHNKQIIDLIKLALNSSTEAHQNANHILEENIKKMQADENE